jgi:Fe-S-cluster-containing dehydrogenase component/DMSO reductase anchor subunit
VTLLSAVAPVGETPVDRYLAEQADLTAVERFSQRHEAELVPRQARYYRDLIPLARPEPGQQYGFEVDLDACTGCKACVAACHSLNGLDDDESWRSVTVLSGGTAAQPLQHTVTAACHHCVDPACLNGCPVDAYEKDPVTGIVSHLDDQCIGCSYCTLTCPYEVPAFNHARGIVRKCDMCKGRLAAGEAPACVQACPNAAIAIKVVETAVALAKATSGALVPGAPPSAITVPTTVYRAAKGRVHDMPAPRPSSPRPASAHPPLAVMLVLTQLSVGAFVGDFLLRVLSNRGSAGPFDAVVAVAAGALALGASVLHLGRPRYCYRAVIGLRHSWLSREVVAFGAFTALAAPYALLLWTGWPGGGRSVPTVLGGVVAALGLAGVACSVLVYATTHRSSWRVSTVAAKFALTTAVCGLATVVWASLVSVMVAGNRGAHEIQTPSSRPLLLVLSALLVAKLAGEALGTRTLQPDLGRTMVGRFAAGLAGALLFALLLVGIGGWPTWSVVAIATLAQGGVLTGELLERSMFFTAASPPR